MRHSTRGGLAAAALLLIAGCASNEAQPPQADLARAELAIEQAVSADATEYAPLPLREARLKLDQARTAMDGERYATAGRLAEEASVNAQLALAEAQTQRAQQIAQENLRGVQTLQQELQRKEAAR